MNNINKIKDEILFDLMNKHYNKFDYYPNMNGRIYDIYFKAILGIYDSETDELISILQKSIDDNIDYLPKRYGFNPKDFEEDINVDVIN